MLMPERLIDHLAAVPGVRFATMAEVAAQLRADESGAASRRVKGATLER